MIKKTVIKLTLCVALFLGTLACGTSLVIENVDYAQPVESVLSPDDDNSVYDQRYAVRFSISPILEAEGVQNVDEIRVIRNRAGLFYITASGFSNVYVFKPEENELHLNRTIGIAGERLEQPAFNQRDTHIELIDRQTGQTYNLDQS